MTRRTKIILIFCVFGFHRAFPQCSISANLTTSGVCLGSTLTASSNTQLAKIVWNNNGAAISTVFSTYTFATDGITVAGGIFPGNTLSQLNFPSQICVDANDDVYIADYDNQRVVKWAPGATSGVLVAGGNGAGTAANQFSGIAGIGIDKQGNLYMADAGNSRVQKWAPGATSGITVAGGHGAGNASNQLKGLEGIFVDDAGAIYIADALNNRIQKWPPGSSTGITVAGGNGQGNAGNQFFNPVDVCVDGAGNIYVADCDNNRIQEWQPGAISGTTVAGGGFPGSGANQFAAPFGVYVDGAGNIYVADDGNCRIQKWIPGASSGVTIAGKGYDGDAPDLLSYPSDVWVDNNGNVFVADELNYRVQEFTVQSSISDTYTPTVAGQYTSSVYTLSECVASTNEITIYPPVTPAVSVNGGAGTLCAGSYATFSAVPVNGGPTPIYEWQINNNVVGGNGPTYSTNNVYNGDIVTCTMTSDTACATSPLAYSVPIILTVDPGVGVAVTITPLSVSACAGTSVTFTASATDGGTQPVYQWLVNGLATGGDSATFTAGELTNGDTVSCVLAANVPAVCSTAVSNPVIANVKPSPTIKPDQVFTISDGQSIQITPNLSGNIMSYSWSPGTDLSDSSIEDPIADPMETTIYELSVVSGNGCQATGPITVKVVPAAKTPIVPSAFTPNGDGKNDVLYILRLPLGSNAKEFAVYDRWGQCVFQARDVTAGDPTHGWNGNTNGKQCSSGTYVYVIDVESGNGLHQVYKGAVILIR